MKSIHGPRPDTTSRKRPYHDYDNDKQYYGGAKYPKRLKYYDAHIDETESSEYTSSDTASTDDEYQPRSLVSCKYSQVHIKNAPPNFTKHDLHTFRVALGHLQNDTWVGDGEYPHEFENRGALLLRGEPPYYTFPLLPPGDTYDGWQRPGPDRVILDRKNVYTNIVTHDNCVLGGFRLIC